MTYPLRGRDLPLASLEGLASSAVAGRGGVAILEGPAGIGKTRLLDEASVSARRRGFLVAAGTADELDQVTPWGMLMAALSSSEPPLVAPAELRALGALLDRRVEVVERLRVRLEEAAVRQPVAVLLDDLQWADAATLLAVGSLPRQLFSYPVVWMLARRPVPTSAGMLGLLERLEGDGAARIPLAELDEDAALALAADVLESHPDPALEKLVADASGNPFYLVEALRSWRRKASHDSVIAASPNQLVASGGLTQVVGHQLRSLSPAGAQVVKVASVLGPSFTVNELSAMTGQPASGLLPAVEETLDAGLFVDDRGQLAFRHDLFRQAVYASIPAAMRPALHRGAADALLAGGAPIVRVATQVAIGAQPGDEAAIDILTQAIGELVGTSPAAAADLALRVLELVAEGDARWPGLVAMAVGVLGWAGRVDEARNLGESFLAGRDVPVGLEAEIQNGMRRAWGQSSHEPFPTPLPEHLVFDPNIPATLRANLVVLTQLAATYLEPEERVKRSLEYARDLIAGTDDPETPATLLAVECNLAWEHGRLSDACQLAHAALERVSGSPPSFTAGTIESTAAIALGTVGQPVAALKLLGIGHQTASACGNSFFMTLCTSERAAVLLELGRVNDARAEARAAFESADDLGFRYFLGQSVGVLVETSIRQGDLSEATAAAHRLLSIGGKDIPSKEQSWVVALCEDANGRPDQAAEVLAPVIDRLRQGRYLMYPSRLPKIVGLALRAGNPEYAEVAAQAASELAARNPGLCSIAAVAAHAEGLLRSDPLAMADSLELFAQGEQPLAAALAHEDLGQLLAKSNEKESCVANLEAAYEAYVLADAYRDVARVRRALADMGVRKRQRAVARPDRGWASLTRTESAVARIVAQGHTNKETAAQLYVSPETVNTHLRHVFAKLGVRSRVELARFVIDHETG